MTQLTYYTAILRFIVLILAWTGGVAALTVFGTMAYYLYPWTKK